MQTLELRDKDVLVLGLGRSGMAAASLLRRDGARVVVRDEAATGPLQERASRLRQLGVRVELGNHFDWSQRFDLAVLSPGIAPERPMVREVAARQTPVFSELELAYRFCLCPVVAVTGTNGKTTTTELIATVLADCGKRTFAAGNNGHAFSDTVDGTAGLAALVLEVSSYQLEGIEQFRPQVAVLLNIRPDHLDRYRRVEDYAAAKARVFMNQEAGDTAVVNVETLPLLEQLGVRLPPRVITFSAGPHMADLWLDWADNRTIWCRRPEARGMVLQLEETFLRGTHNAENIMATLATGLALELPIRPMLESIRQYAPPPHRLEFVAQIEGVTWVNDSKATNVDATQRALETVGGPAVLIAGGRDKGLDFDGLRATLAHRVKRVVLIGETRERLQRAWGDVVPCTAAGSLAEAVVLAARTAAPGDTVLLSPGCASFDMFDNYEQRGEAFKHEVLALRDGVRD